MNPQEMHVKVTQTSALARGHCRIEVDGEDITKHVRGYQITADGDGLTTVTLDLLPRRGVVFDGPAVVEALAERSTVDPARFLRAMSPVELERAALARVHEFDGEHALTRAMLVQLAEWAEGKV